MLKLENISLKYGRHLVIDRLSYEFEENKKTLIIVSSGIGKTSLLNIAAGLTKASSGKVSNGFEKISYVFQEPRLFDWLTALENVSTVSDETEARETLSLMGLSDAGDKYPSELSGGMKQRVSIARALAYRPDLVFLDEPFKGLDAETRENIANTVFEKLEGKTVIFVSHDESDRKYADVILRLTKSPGSTLELVKSNSVFSE